MQDYASDATRFVGEEVIGRELKLIPSDKIRSITQERLCEIACGKRDFRF